MKELSQYGQLVSPIRMVSLSCKSLKIKHAVCHSRQVMMILKDKESPLNLARLSKRWWYDYMVLHPLRTWGVLAVEQRDIRSTLAPGKCGAQSAPPAAAAAIGGTWVLVSFRSIAPEKLCWFYKPTTVQVRILLARRLLPVSFTGD